MISLLHIQTIRDAAQKSTASLTTQGQYMLVEALDELLEYRKFAATGDMAKMARRSQILLSYIATQPEPVRKAWASYLEDEHAL